MTKWFRGSTFDRLSHNCALFGNDCGYVFGHLYANAHVFAPCRWYAMVYTASTEKEYRPFGSSSLWTDVPWKEVGR